MESPELLETGWRLIASQEPPGLVVQVVVFGCGCDEGCELTLIRFFRIPNIDQIDIFDLEILVMVDLVVRNLVI